MSKNPMLLKKWDELWWSGLTALDSGALTVPSHDDELTSTRWYPESTVDEWHALNRQYRRLVSDLSEGMDDWHRVHYAVPHASRESLGSTMALQAVLHGDRRRWLRLHWLHATLFPHVTKARELLRVMRQLTEFFDDQQLLRIHEYLVRMPRIFRGGDATRVSYILACLNMELERHGYTILRQHLLDEINKKLDLHVTKNDIKKAQWQILKLDKHWNKARLKERLTNGTKWQRMIFISVVDELLRRSELASFLKLPTKTHQVKVLALHVFDAYLQARGNEWIRNDLELLAVACVDLALDVFCHHVRARKPSLPSWLPPALHVSLNHVRILRSRIKKTIGVTWEQLTHENMPRRPQKATHTLNPSTASVSQRNVSATLVTTKPVTDVSSHHQTTMSLPQCHGEVTREKTSYESSTQKETLQTMSIYNYHGKKEEMKSDDTKHVPVTMIPSQNY